MTATIHQGDAVTWLRSLPSGSVDLIDTDVAYESMEKHREKGTTTRLKKSAGSSNEWFHIFRNERFPEFFDESYRVLAPHRHLYFWCDFETATVAKPIAGAAGFDLWTPIVWNKVAIGMGYHYRSQYELILFLSKGKRKIADLGIGNVITEKRLRGLVCDRCQNGLDIDGDLADKPCETCKRPRRKAYPTEKNVRVHATLIAQSTQPGELVIDPFMGSASAGVAALAAGRRFAGNDIAAESIVVAQARIPGAVLVPSVPPYVEPGQAALFGASP